MTTIPSSERTYTLADLEHLQDRDDYELVDGELVPRNMSNPSQRSAFRAAKRIDNHLDVSPGGSVWTEAGLGLWGHRRGRRADAAYFGPEWSIEQLQGAWLKAVPGLVIEALSPGDEVIEFDKKLADYRAAGIRLIWVINPYGRWVEVYRDGATTPERFGPDDTLDGGSVLPGLTIPVVSLFDVSEDD